jgi:hypothetical protein
MVALMVSGFTKQLTVITWIPAVMKVRVRVDCHNIKSQIPVLSEAAYLLSI